MKYPGGDYLENTDAVTGENDLLALTASLTPSLTVGTVTLSRSNANVRVWKSSTKGSANAILTGDTYDANTQGNGKKTWDLSDAAQRSDFNAVASSLYVEGASTTGGSVTLSYTDGSVTVIPDDIVYTTIAAVCGNQPTVDQRTYFSDPNHYGDLADCEWSVTDAATNSYNCYAFSVGVTNHFFDAAYIDNHWGDGVPPLEDSEMDAFYAHYGLTPTATGPGDAKVMLFGSTNTPLHAALRRNCSCGAGMWIMYESKCGSLERIEHVYNQINGPDYGAPYRYYK